MNEFKEVIFGSLTVGSFAGYFLYALIGAAVQMYMEVAERNKDSQRSPFRFSWKFFAIDNIFRGITTVIFIFVFFRFFEEINHTPLTAWSALMAGFSVDRLSQLYKKKTTAIKAYSRKFFKNNSNGNIS